MATEEEPAILICASVEGAREDQIPGTIISSCGSCDAKIYIAPSGQAVIKSENARPLCLRCGRLAIEIQKDQTGGLPEFGIAPGAKEELTTAWEKEEENERTE